MLLPVVALVISNADVLLLALARPRADGHSLPLVLGTTIPLSVAAGGATLWFLLRLRAEVDRRAGAEREARDALADLDTALQRERLLRRELDHRVRNNLAALLALVGMYEETDASRAEMVSSLRSRVLALRESYGLIAAAHADGVELADLLRAVFAAVLGGGPPVDVTIDGPPVLLSSRQANAMAMIAQELLTNAAKHGALSGGVPGVVRGSDRPVGVIAATWKVVVTAGTPTLDFRWREYPLPEAGGPSAAPAQDGRAGLGLTLIEGFATGDLRGSVSYGRVQDPDCAEAVWSVDLTATLNKPEAETPARHLKETLA